MLCCNDLGRSMFIHATLCDTFYDTCYAIF